MRSFQMKGHFRRKSLSKSPYSEILKFARVVAVANFRFS